MLVSPDALDIELPAFWLRIGTALLCGGAIGVERQLRGKASGARTCILVCLGTEIFVSLGSAVQATTTDPTRVLGQVITGIGFLGAGVILARDGRLLGVTSAAVIWILAGIGAAIGLGFLAPSIVLTLVSLVVLIGVEALESVWTRFGPGSRETRLDHLEMD